MTTEVFTSPEYTASATVFFRLFNSSGQAFDFNDNTFKALVSCTTPYVAGTERTSMGGTGKSCWQASINLANINDTGAIGRYTLKAYMQAGGSPADSDAAISGGLPLTIQFGELGEREIVCQAEISVKSTAGNACQVSAWLEWGGKKIGIATNGGTVFTAATSDVITSAGHGLSNGDVLILTTSGTLPAGLSTNTPYYVIDKTTDTFKLSTSAGGSAVDITDTGSGVHKWHNPTATVTVREHESGANLFSKSLNAADLVQTAGGTIVSHVFEGEQASPNFTDDRQYHMEVSITENGVTHTSQHNRVVIG